MLLRPFVDLEPCPVGPLYARGIEFYWNAFVDEGVTSFVLQRTLSPAFRTQLAKEIGISQTGMTEPQNLCEELQTERWKLLCHATGEWSDLSPKQKCRLVLLLHSLCFYRAIERLVPEVDFEAAQFDS